MKWIGLGSILAAWVSITLKAQTSNIVANPKSERTALKIKAPSQPEAPPATKVKLTGFTTLGVQRAFFVLIDETAKASQSISLTIDEQMAGLKLIEIDPVLRTVRVVQDGVEKALTFDHDGVAGAIAVAAPAATTPSPPAVQGSPRSVSPRNSAPASPRNRTTNTRGRDSSNTPAFGNRFSPSQSERPESPNPRNRRSPSALRPPR